MSLLIGVLLPNLLDVRKNLETIAAKQISKQWQKVLSFTKLISYGRIILRLACQLGQPITDPTGGVVYMKQSPKDPLYGVNPTGIFLSNCLSHFWRFYKLLYWWVFRKFIETQKEKPHYQQGLVGQIVPLPICGIIEQTHETKRNSKIQIPKSK